MKKFLPLFIVLIFSGASAFTQTFTHSDSLRGKLTPLRTCYDVRWYDLKVKVDPMARSISGTNMIRFYSMSDFSTLQIDLFAGMHIDSIVYEKTKLEYTRDENAVFVKFPQAFTKGKTGNFLIGFSGRPTVARNAPWDGGFVWTVDKNQKTWVGVACEGVGASLWWPLKDHLSDEPDSMRITVTAPENLMSVANGSLRKTFTPSPGWKSYEWAVTYPINSYNVTVNIADYVQIHDTLQNASGTHDLDYYVLSYNRDKAIAQFKQVKPMMQIYEKYFGEYPFWRDGYALVETPYLGMEHQGAIAYGNEYLKGYAGYDPLQLGFDYIVIHESGHEWWGNSVSTDDHAELWIHESFCTYGEAVYVEAMWGKQKAIDYLVNQRGNILNLQPIIGIRDVNYNEWVGSDMYYKGAWMLHTLRNCVNDDLTWWDAIHDFATENKLKVINTTYLIDWFNRKLGKNYSPVFRQYLYHAAIPTLEYKVKKKKGMVELTCRWLADEPGFNMPVEFTNNSGQIMRAQPEMEWKTFLLPGSVKGFRVDTDNFLVKVNPL